MFAVGKEMLIFFSKEALELIRLKAKRKETLPERLDVLIME